MTVPASTSRSKTVAGSGAVAFYFNFRTTSPSHIEVFLDDVEQATGVAVSLNADQDSSPGGSVVFDTAPADGAVVRIQRTVPLTQPTNLASLVALRAETLEGMLDLATMQSQQLDRGAADALAAVADEVAARVAGDEAVGAAVAALNQGSHAVTDTSSVLAYGTSYPRTLTARFADVINVKDFGALGDGATDDTDAIQAAIDYAKTVGVPVTSGSDGYTEHNRLGVRIVFPAGRYMLGSPVVMPRSGTNMAHIITLDGGTRYSTTLAAMSTFPTGRAMIEWEPVAKRVFNQGVVNFTFDMGAVDLIKAIHFQPTLKTTQAEAFAESMNWMTFQHLAFLADNSKHTDAIHIEGQIDYSLFDDLSLDSRQAISPAVALYSTNLIHFDSDYSAAPITPQQRGFDIIGGNFLIISRLTQGFRGGWGTFFRGRLSNTRISDSCHGVGALGHDPAIHLINSGNVTLSNINFEGRQEDAELWLDHSSDIYARGLTLGITSYLTGGGVGIRFTDARRCIIEGRASDLGNSSFFAGNSKLIAMDALSKDNDIRMMFGANTFANEVEWLSPGTNRNRIEYVDVTTGVRTVKDETVPAIAAITGNPALLTDAATKADVNAILTALRNAGIIN